ncbi:MAG: DNA-processing protein DprA [Flavobacteriales bacterium]|nr:DNA-processing protein DprA [Flavobacteriales bacterium]MDW8410122.1 DNA-processing protein DprA [Flavobacteriales bacterium]
MDILRYCESQKDLRKAELAAVLWLLQVPGVGPFRLRQWKLKHKTLIHVLHLMADSRYKSRQNLMAENASLKRVDEELRFLERHGIQVYLWSDEDYPRRLKQCNDAPYLLFFKGSTPPEGERIIAVVGTRSATEKARRFTAELLAGLAPYRPVIVSGLALGIDTAAHRAALDLGLTTVAVVGHGLDRIYPATNRNLAMEILKQGGVLTEFPSGTKPDKPNFPRRNRIIAGLADAVIVVETSATGGAMITARIAESYHREVFAVPGRPWESHTEGCNMLLRSHSAQILLDPEDVVRALHWDELFAQQAVANRNHFPDLTPEEQEVVEFLKNHSPSHLEEIGLHCQQMPAQLASTLLNLEISGIIRALPGRRYELA